MSAVQYLMRNPSHVVLTGRNSVFFIGTSGAPARVSVERPADWSRFLQDLAGPSPATRWFPRRSLTIHCLSGLSQRNICWPTGRRRCF